ncbi:hypothetical protein KOR42_44620 [Thalassoglobus neptunius]|uniref:DUF7939 domain-containing protein n=1 Tax=Thalassoglobus neptunius TaxID=1938619 RepID=A0A5C5W0L5_9PLAN|nr:BatD family protein [Thalassoglobus neptunius]TWT43521.1 hypothetical protein KOR42_44620 [Thalassoglobus neptunius]
MTRIAVFVLSVLLCPSLGWSAETIQAELGKESVWIGQGIPLIVTLCSPGPFSSAAAFDLPELPSTVILKMGNPVVGSENVDGESLLTQRHEFAIFTQQAGTITVPSFRVRYSSKPSFTGKSEDHSVQTSPVTFESKRPPNTEPGEIVISVPKLEFTQSWTPDDQDELAPGDVIQRTMIRRAEGVTAMLMPPISMNLPDGVRSYPSSPKVVDTVQRGVAKAERTDSVKIQFERPGTYTIPDVDVRWWNPDDEAFESKSLPGRTISVSGAIATAETTSAFPSTRTANYYIAAVVLVLIVLSFLFGKRAWHALSAYFNQPETQLLRRLKDACQKNDASAAYQAWMNWTRLNQHIVGDGSADEIRRVDEASRVVNDLEFRLFGGGNPEEWTGQPLWEIVSQLSRVDHHRKKNAMRFASHDLPELNPVSTVES